MGPASPSTTRPPRQLRHHAACSATMPPVACSAPQPLLYLRTGCSAPPFTRSRSRHARSRRCSTTELPAQLLQHSRSSPLASSSVRRFRPPPSSCLPTSSARDLLLHPHCLCAPHARNPGSARWRGWLGVGGCTAEERERIGREERKE